MLVSKLFNDTSYALLIVLFNLEVLLAVEVKPVVLFVMPCLVVGVVLVDLVGPLRYKDRFLLRSEKLYYT